ncbi:MAG: hypothetical protein QM770_02785 [Tepidisphaeraceae bacterium]
MSEVTSVSIARPNAIVSTLTRPVAVTVAGVATMFLANKLIAATGEALHLPQMCWQMLAVRSALLGAVASTLLVIRCDRLAIFGVLYGLTLVLAHFSWPLLISATLAGVLAAGVRWALRSRESFVATLLPVLTLSVVLTGGSLFKAIEKGTFGSYSTDVLLRASVTVAIGAIVWGIARLVRSK